MMDLSVLVQSKQLMHEGQFVAIGGLFGSVGWIDVHMVIEDWYDNNGYSLNKEDYEKHEEEYNNWRTQAMLLRAGRLRHRGDDGGDEHEPEKPTFLSGERQPRLLSEALASIADVKQIDGVPKGWLEWLSRPVYETEDKEAEGVAEDKEDNSQGVSKNKEGDSDGTSKDNEPLSAENIVTQTGRKATDLEMKERRKELVDFIKKMKEEKTEKLKTKDNEQEENSVEETESRGQGVAETGAVQKDAVENLAENGMTEKEVGPQFTENDVAEQATEKDLMNGMQ
jgi:hypothetical protein